MPRPTRRRLTLPQIQRHLKAIVLDLAAIGGAYGVPAATLRFRALSLHMRVQELIDRFPI